MPFPCSESCTSVLKHNIFPWEHAIMCVCVCVPPVPTMFIVFYKEQSLKRTEWHCVWDTQVSLSLALSLSSRQSLCCAEGWIQGKTNAHIFCSMWRTAVWGRMMSWLSRTPLTSPERATVSATTHNGHTYRRKTRRRDGRRKLSRGIHTRS